MTFFLRSVVVISLLGLFFTGHISITDFLLLVGVYLLIEAVTGALIELAINLFASLTYRPPGYESYAERISHIGAAGRRRMDNLSDEYIRNVRDTLRR